MTNSSPTIFFVSAYRFLLLFALLLSGCNSTPVKDESRASNKYSPSQDNTLTPFALYEKAQSFYTLWDTHKKREDLEEAYRYSKAAYNARPFNLVAQKLYYTVLVNLGFQFDDVTEDELALAFDALHPNVKADSAAPAKILYARNIRLKAEADALVPYLYRAIKQKPNDAHTWRQLSEQLAVLGQYDLSISSANIGNHIEPNTDYSSFAVAKAYNNKIESGECFYSDVTSIKRAAFHSAKSAKIKESDYANGFVALQYLRLGLYPLAHQFAVKANDKTHDKWSTTLLVDILLNLKRYNQALELTIQNGKRDPYLVALSESMLALSESRLHDARLWYQKSYNNKSIYHVLVENWLTSLIEGKNVPINISPELPNNPWEKSLGTFLKYPNIFKSSHLIEKATNVCRKTDAHFYTAMQFWREGNIGAAKKHLELTKKQGVPRYREHILADLIIDLL